MLTLYHGRFAQTELPRPANESLHNQTVPLRRGA